MVVSQLMKETEMSYTPEVQVDSTGEWRGAAVSFATEEEAINYIVSRASRGTSLLDIRVVESGHPVNYSWVNGKAERVTPPSSCGSIERRRGRGKGEVTGMRTSRWTWRFAWLCVREAWERRVSRAGQSGQPLYDLSVATERKGLSAS
jgi:hypothetical protein